MTGERGSRHLIGFVGLGNMGLPICRRLLNAGFAVRGFDVNPDASATLTGHADFAVSSDAAGVCREADAVILMLPGSDIVERVLLVQHVLDATPPSAVLIDMSSSVPARTRALAAEAARSGVTMLDAPVSGGVRGAIAGTLTIMVGGSETGFQTVTPILNSIGSRVLHVGGPGAGHAVKALNNLLSAAHLVASSEALLAAREFGLDLNVVLELINSSSGASASTQYKWPNYVLTETFASGFGLRLMLKDVRIGLDLVHQGGIRSTAVDAVEAMWSEAADELPPGADHTEIVRWLEANVTQDHSRVALT